MPRPFFPCDLCKDSSCIGYLYKDTFQKVKDFETVSKEINGIQPENVKIFAVTEINQCPHYDEIPVWER